MATVFVSYRHEDGAWAGRIHDALEDRYDVYFDTERPPGETWRAELEKELEDCRVLVAVVGKGWRSERNLERLRLEGDLVRGELLRALGKKGIRVIPVLVKDVGEEDEKPGPDGKLAWERALPDALAPFAGLQRTTLNHYEFKRDVGALLTTVEGWLAGQGTLQRGKIPEVLPHLCDRVEPQDGFVDLAAAAGPSVNTLMVVVRGHKSEGHGGFLRRLVDLGVVDDALGTREGVPVVLLDWNRQLALQGRYRELLARRIKKACLGRELLPDDELARWIAAPGQARMFVLQLTWEDHRACGEGLLPGIAEAWRGLFELRRPDGTVEAIVPSHPLVLWVNFSYDEPAQASGAPRLAEGTLDLGPLMEEHVRSWLENPRVKQYAVEHEAELRHLIDEPGCYFEEGERHKLHMEVFADKVREILERA